MLGAIAEGMRALDAKRKVFGFDLADVIRVYNNGSVVQGRLMGWLARAWRRDPGLSRIRGVVPVGATEGEMKRLERSVELRILHEARMMRERSRRRPSFCGKIIAAVRREFGGHEVQKEK